MKTKIALLAILAVLLAALLCEVAYGKYATSVNVGSVEIIVSPKERQSILPAGKELNRFLRLYRPTAVVFDFYENRPEMKGKRGHDIGDEADKIKIHYYGNTAYVLSENVICASSLEKMFENCTSLKRAEFYNFDTSNVTSMKNMFYNCSRLKTVVMNFDTTKVEDMSGAFYRCMALQSLDLGSFDTSSVTDMRNMFRGCSNLVTVYASEKWSTVSVAYGENMFKGCYKLVGGNGTKYGRDYSVSYAKIDKVASPGYFTEKTNP